MNAAPAPSRPPALWRRKDLLGIQDLSAEEITLLLDTAQQFKDVGARDIKKVPALRGRTLVNFFVEPSTRTRTSFELAAMRLSADVVNISASSSSLVKGETLKDTALVLQANNVDIIVIRHCSAGAAQFLAERLDSSIINAGDGAHEHPTQALLDLFTIREKRGRIAGLHVAIVGDILFSRVARSNIWGLLKLGARVTLVGPTHAGAARVRADGRARRPAHRRRARRRGCHQPAAHPARTPAARVLSRVGRVHQPVRPDPRAGRPPAARLPHHAPRTDQPRRGNRQRRGRRSRHSVILDQVTNGLAVRMAALYLCADSARRQP